MEQEPPGVQHKQDSPPVVTQPKLQKPKTPPIRKAGKSGNTKPLEEFELARYQYCGQDSDCVAVTNGCCDCANGGEDVAVNKLRVEAFRKRFDCLHVSCAGQDADPPCGEGVVTCLNHKCKYVAKQITWITYVIKHVAITPKLQV